MNHLIFLQTWYEVLNPFEILRIGYLSVYMERLNTSMQPYTTIYYHIGGMENDIDNLTSYLRNRLSGYDYDRSSWCQTDIMRALCTIVQKWLNDPKHRQGNYHVYLVWYACVILLSNGFMPVSVSDVTNMYFNEECLPLCFDVAVDYRDWSQVERQFFKIRAVANYIGKEVVRMLGYHPQLPKFNGIPLCL